MQDVYVGVPDRPKAQQKNPTGVAYMLVELVAQNLLYLSFACIHVQHSCFPQWLGFSPYSRENHFSQAIFPAILDLLQVRRMGERDRSTGVQLSFCSDPSWLCVLFANNT